MAGKSIAVRPASWRVLYVDATGASRVATFKTQTQVSTARSWSPLVAK